MITPAAIKAIRADRVLEITWSDGHHWRYPFRYLRESCGCAHCVHEVTGERMLDPNSLPADLQLEKINLVGNYALKIRWSDGHDTGLYAWDRLRELCRCDECRS